MVRKSFFTVVEGAVNAVATNKDANHVVVAGRNVLKMFEIRDDINCFVEKINLRVGKNLNLNFNTNDVVWNHLDEDIVATAATNGAVVVWNLERNSRCKLEALFQDHRRTVNKICFHPTEVNLLLSGSQDGTMKLFDLRKKEAASTFLSLSESVRDVQFSNFRDSVFAAVQENGNVQVWDLRKNDKPEKQFTAHSGPVFACDWHPEEKKWLATAGRDSTIKVWDLSKKPQCCYCIQTMAPVARVIWRPQRRNNIASSSLVVDFSVYIWDIDRPYVPFAAFMEHTDVTTAITWRNDPHTLISAGKDATLYQHVFKDAQRPASQANNVGLDMNIRGDVCLAVSDYILKSRNYPNYQGGQSSIGNSTFFPAMASYALNINNSNSTSPFAQFATDKINAFKKNTDLTEKFKCSSSTLRIFQNSNTEKILSIEWFEKTALGYKLFGKPFAELCAHNAAIAMELDRAQVAQAWKILSLLYSSNKNQPAHIGDPSEDKPFDGAGSSDSKSRHISKGTSGEPRIDIRIPSVTSIDSLPSSRMFRAEKPETNPANDSHSQSSEGDENTLPDDNDDQSGVFFAEEEMVSSAANFPTDFDMTPPEQTFDDLDEKNIFTDSFQVRNSIDENYLLPGLDIFPSSSNSRLKDSLTSDDDSISKNIDKLTLDEESSKCLLSSSLPPIPSWKFSDIVIDMLQDYANKGDIQTTVSMMIVLGEKLKNSLDESLQEFWVHSYIELLSRFQLWNIVNQIIRACDIPNINSINQTSTTIYTSCGKCQKGSMGKVAWLCDKCKALPSLCSICHGIVKGLYVWCQGCSHGGHLQHITEWLKVSRECPSGCGHQCEYT